MADGPRQARGALSNPISRFAKLEIDPTEMEWIEEDGEEPIRSTYFDDPSETILSFNDSPDLGFSASVNPYRGCEHGCIYCYARPTHEYLEFGAGLDFETKILVKKRSAALLRAAFEKSSWRPQVVAMSGVTDPYQPVERALGIVRPLLEVFQEYRNPVSIVTKNALVTRDIGILNEMLRWNGICVSISVTTMDGDLRQHMEPRTSPFRARMRAVSRLADAGIPVGVLTAPLIPGLNDSEMPQILEQAAEAGATFAHYSLVRLPHRVKDLFIEWLRANYPNRAEKTLGLIQSVRGGKLNETAFGQRLRGVGAYADQVGQLFDLSCRRLGLQTRMPHLNSAAFRRPGRGEQLELF